MKEKLEALRDQLSSDLDDNEAQLLYFRALVADIEDRLRVAAADKDRLKFELESEQDGHLGQSAVCYKCKKG